MYNTNLDSTLKTVGFVVEIISTMILHEMKTSLSAQRNYN